MAFSTQGSDVRPQNRVGVQNLNVNPPPVFERSNLACLRRLLLVCAGVVIGVLVAVALAQGFLSPSGAVLLVALVALVITTQFYRLLKPTTGVSIVLWVALAWVSLLGVVAVAAPILPLGAHADTSLAISTPGFIQPNLFSEHPLGTNRFGLDILARLVWGGRTTLMISLGAVIIGSVLGGTLGATGSYFGGFVSRSMNIVITVGLAFPPLILLMIASPVVGRRTWALMLVLAVLTIPSTMRLTRANTLAVTQRGFITVAEVIGGGHLRILFREILPNVAGPLFVYALLSLPTVVVATASLSFLGLGIPQPQPTWGNMIAEGLGGVFEKHPFVVFVPSLVLFVTILAFNGIGEGAKRRLDSRRGKL